MTDNEAIVQLTLKAMELGHINFLSFSSEDESDLEKWNAFNAKQISDYVIALSNRLLPNG